MSDEYIIDGAASPLSPVGAKLFGADAAGNVGWVYNKPPHPQYAPIVVASEQNENLIEYTVNTGSPTVTRETSPQGLPCLKIVTSAYTELVLPQMVGRKYSGYACVAMYGSKSLTGLGTIELRMYDGAGTSNYKRGRWYQNASATPTQSYIEQGGATVINFNPSNTVDVGSPAAEFEMTQARLVINPDTTPCTFYLYAVGLGYKRKSRLAVVFDDGIKSAFTLGHDSFRNRGIRVTNSIIAEKVGTANYADLDMLKSFVAGGNACVAHGPIEGGSLIDNYTDAGTRVQSAVADVLHNIKFLADNRLLVHNAEKCYIWPQGKYQWVTGDTSLLDALIARGVVLSRAAVITATADIGYCIGIDSCGKYQRMAAPIIGHTWATTTAAEATNIAAIVTRIQAIAANAGQDAYLMLHNVVPTATADGSMLGTDIRKGDLETIAAAIKTLIDAGTLDAVTMPEFYSGETYWSQY